MTDEKWTATGWVTHSRVSLTLTDVDPEVLALLRGPEQPAQAHLVQVDYRTPVKLSWWRRVWLWVRRKPAPTIQRQLVIPNASMAVTDPTRTGDTS